MELLGEVEENLRVLSVEARKSKQLSGVKEAAERGTLKLRSLKENYAGYLRQKRKAEEDNSISISVPSSQSTNDSSEIERKLSTSSINENQNQINNDGSFSFQSHDLLQPFLLACNYMDVVPKLTLLSLSGIQHLVNRDAVHPEDGPNVMRVLSIQANSPSTEVQLRVLQTSLLLVSSKSCTITEDLLSKALLVCFNLSQSKDTTVRNAATATVRQVLSMLFDRVVREQVIAQRKLASEKQEVGSEPMTMGLEGVGRCAYLVFQDLCVLSRGEQGVWLKRTCVAPSMGLELVESVLAQQPQLFSTDPMFSTLVSRQVCPLLLQILHERIDFPLFVRVMRAFTTLLRDFGHILIEQCEPLLAALLHCLASSSLSLDVSFSGFENGVGAAPAERVWSSLLVLESLQAVCSDSELLFTLYRVYDCAEKIEVVKNLQMNPTSPASSPRRRPVPLVSNMVNVISHFLNQATMSDQGMGLLLQGLKSLSSANHAPFKHKSKLPNSSTHAIASNIASTFNNLTSNATSISSQTISPHNVNSESSSSGNSRGLLPVIAVHSGQSINTASSMESQQQPRSNTNTTTNASTLFAGSYSFRELSLETQAPSPHPEGETYAIALNCLLAISDSLRSVTIDSFGATLPKPVRFQNVSLSGIYRIIQPPSSKLTKNKSTLSLDDFLNDDDDDEVVIEGVTASSDVEISGVNDAICLKTLTEEKELMNDKCLDQLRNTVRAFVSSTWEHFLSVVSQLLLFLQSSPLPSSLSSHGPSSSSITSSSSSSSSSSSASSSSVQIHHTIIGGAGVSTSGANTGETHGNQQITNSSVSKSGSSTPTINPHRVLLDKLLCISISLTVSAGACGLSAPRDCLLGALCKASTPTPLIHHHHQSPTDGNSLHPQNIAVLKAVLIVAHSLANSLGPAWSVIVAALDKVDVVLRKASPGKSLTKIESRLTSALNRFIAFTTVLELSALSSVLEALMNMNRTNLRLGNSPVLSPHSSFSSAPSPLPPKSTASASLSSVGSSSSTRDKLENTNNVTVPPNQSSGIDHLEYDFAQNQNNGGGFGRAIGSLLSGVSDRFGVGQRLVASANSFYAPVTPGSGGPSSMGHISSTPPSSANPSSGSSSHSARAVVDASASFSSSSSVPPPSPADTTLAVKTFGASSSSSSNIATSPSSSSSSSLSRATVPVTSSVPFALRSLVAIASANQHRLKSLWPDIVAHLALVANTARSPALRCFAIDSFRTIAKDILSEPPTSNSDMKTTDAPKTTATVTTSSSSAMQTSSHSNTMDKNLLSDIDINGKLKKSVGMLIEGNFDDIIFEELFLIQPHHFLKSSSHNHHEKHIQEKDPYHESRLKEEFLLDPLLSIAEKSNMIEVKEQVLLALHGLVASCGSNMTNIWSPFFTILAIACGRHHKCDAFTYPSSMKKKSSLREDGVVRDLITGGRVVSWGGQCVPIAFRCLKLVADDFLECVPKPLLPKVVECAAAFAEQEVDMNVSLTAIELLWQVADFNQHQPSPLSPSLMNNPHSPEKDDNQLKSKKNEQISNDNIPRKGSEELESSSSQTSLEVWYIMLRELSRVAVDSRPEVRNCGVNTLVSSVVAHGNSLSLDQWQFTFAEVLIPLVQTAHAQMEVAAKVGEAGTHHEVRPGVPLAMHHSRDTASKQWSETKVLALQGLARLLRCALTSPLHREFVVSSSYHHKMKQRNHNSAPSSPRITLKEKKAEAAAAAMNQSQLKSNSSSSKLGESSQEDNVWFSEVWHTMLSLGLDSISALSSRSGGKFEVGGGSVSEVAVAGIALLILMNKISSSHGISNDPVRYAVGMRVVNGALVQMDQTKIKAAATAALATDTQGGGAQKKWSCIQAWESSWLVLMQACDCYCVDEEGDISNALVEGFAQIFKSSNDTELSQPAHIVELLNALACLIPPRYPSLIPGQRKPFRLPITKAQKNALLLLKSIALKLKNYSERFEGDEGCWYSLVSLLSKFSIPTTTPSSSEAAGTTSSVAHQPQNVLSTKFCASSAELLLELFSLNPCEKETKQIKADIQHCLLSYLPENMNDMKKDELPQNESNQQPPIASIPHWAIASSFQGLLTGLFPLSDTTMSSSSSSSSTSTLKPFVVDGVSNASNQEEMYSLFPPVLRSPQAANRWLVGLTKHVLAESCMPTTSIVSTINTLVTVAAPGLRAIVREDTLCPSVSSTVELTTTQMTINDEISSNHTDNDSFAEFACANDDDIPPPVYPWQMVKNIHFQRKVYDLSLLKKSLHTKHTNLLFYETLPSSKLELGWYQLVSSSEQLLLPWCIKNHSTPTLSVESSVDMRRLLLSLVVDDKLVVFPPSDTEDTEFQSSSSSTSTSSSPLTSSSASSSSSHAAIRIYHVPSKVSIKSMDMLANVLFGLTTATLLTANQSDDNVWNSRRKQQSSTNKESNYVDGRWELGEVPLIVFIVKHFSSILRVNEIDDPLSMRCLLHLHSWSHFVLLLCVGAHRLKPLKPMNLESSVITNQSSEERVGDVIDEDGVGFEPINEKVAGAIETLSLLSLQTLKSLLLQTNYTSLNDQTNHHQNSNSDDDNDSNERKVNWMKKKTEIQNIILSLAPLLCENVAGVGAHPILRKSAASLLRESKISETIHNLRNDVEKSKNKALEAETKLNILLQQQKMNGENSSRHQNTEGISAEAYATGFPF